MLGNSFALFGCARKKAYIFFAPRIKGASRQRNHINRESTSQEEYVMEGDRRPSHDRETKSSGARRPWFP